MYNTTFINCNESKEQELTNKAYDCFNNIESNLIFWETHGLSVEDYEYGYCEDMTEEELKDEFYDDEETISEIRYTLEEYQKEGSFHDYGLDIDFVEADADSNGYYRFLIMTGGPHAEFRFYQKGLIEFVYQNWFVGVGFNVSNNTIEKWLRDHFKDCGILDFDSKTDEQLYQEFHTIGTDEE